MIDYIGITIIILAVVGSVHFVSEKAYKRGKEAGMSEGRLQVLQEDLIREERKSKEDSTIIELEKFLTKELPRVDRVSKKA